MSIYCLFYQTSFHLEPSIAEEVSLQKTSNVQSNYILKAEACKYRPRGKERRGFEALKEAKIVN